MTSGKADEEFFKARGFSIKIGFGERPALILIDMLKGFTDASMPLGANLDKEIAAQKPLVEDSFAVQHGIGAMSLERWTRLATQLLELGLIDEPANASACFAAGEPSSKETGGAP